MDAGRKKKSWLLKFSGCAGAEGTMSAKGMKASVKHLRLAMGKSRLKARLDEVTRDKLNLVANLQTYVQKKTEGTLRLLEKEDGRMTIGSPDYRLAIRDLERCCEQICLITMRILELLEESDAEDDRESFEDFRSCAGDVDQTSVRSANSLASVQAEMPNCKVPSVPTCQAREPYSPHVPSSLVADASVLPTPTFIPTWPTSGLQQVQQSLYSLPLLTSVGSSSNHSGSISLPSPSLLEAGHFPNAGCENFVPTYPVSTDARLPHFVAGQSVLFDTQNFATSQEIKRSRSTSRSTLSVPSPPPQLYQVPLGIAKNVPPFGKACLVIPNFIGSPSDFYVNVKNEDSKEMYNSIRSKLDNVKTIPKTHVPVSFGFYLALFDHTPAWYRVQVLQVHAADPTPWCLVFYVDYGNTKPVPFASMAFLNADLTQVPPLAFHCFLDGVAPLGSSWDQQSTQTFMELMRGDTLTATFCRTERPSETAAKLPPCMEYRYALNLEIGHSGRVFSVAEYMVMAGMARQISDNAEETETTQKVETTREVERAESRSEDAVAAETSSSRKWNVGAKEFKSQLTDTRSEQSRTPSPLDSPAKHLPWSTADEERLPVKDSADFVLNGSGRGDELPQSVPIHPLLKTWNKELLTCLTSAIENPSEFYVHLCSENSDLIDEQQEMMNKFYKSEGVPSDFSEPVLIGSFWACEYPADSSWYRVAIVDSLDAKNGAKPKKLSPESKVLVQFVDWGNTLETTVSNLRHLTSEFCKLPSFALPCALSLVGPPEGESWSEEAKKRMVDLVGTEQIFSLRVQNQLPGNRLEVLLWINEGEDVLLNNRLVEERLAVHVVDPKNQPAEDDETRARSRTDQSRSLRTQNSCENGSRVAPVAGGDASLDQWDPMSEAYNSTRNSYATADDDADLAVTGLKSKDGYEVCHFYNMGRHCPRGEVCPFKHAMLTDGATQSNEEEMLSTSIPSLNLPVGAYVYSTVSAISSPSHFYLNFPYGCRNFKEVDEEDFEVESLEILNKEMTRVYKSNQLLEDKTYNPALGTLVAARSNLDDKWYRAVVMGQNRDGSKFDVMFVDFGTEEEVERKFVHKLDLRFTHLPAQAAECTMDVEPAGQDCWTQEAQSKFFKWVNGQNVLAKILKPWDDSSKSRVKLFVQVRNQIRDVARELVECRLAVQISVPEGRSRNNLYPQ